MDQTPTLMFSQTLAPLFVSVRLAKMADTKQKCYCVAMLAALNHRYGARSSPTTIRPADKSISHYYFTNVNNYPPVNEFTSFILYI